MTEWDDALVQVRAWFASGDLESFRSALERETRVGPYRCAAGELLDDAFADSRESFLAVIVEYNPGAMDFVRQRLSRAVAKENQKLVELLLQLGVNGNVVLTEALLRGSVPIAALALSRGADASQSRVHAPDPVTCDWNEVGSAWPPFVIVRSREMGELLLRHGAELDAKDDHLGWTSLHFAAAAGDLGADLRHEIYPRCLGGDELTDLLLDLGADANAASPEGVTPLHVAAHYGGPRRVGALVRAGADPDRASTRPFSLPKRFGSGTTPLDVAQRRGKKGASLVDVMRGH